MDSFLILFLNTLANKYAPLGSAVILLAKYLPYALVALVFLLILLPTKKISGHLRLMLGFAVISGFVARFLIKPFIAFFYERPRPPIVLSGINNLIKYDSVASFPSGHMLFFFAVALVIFLYNKKFGWIFFTGAALVGIARIFAGVHWPSDILGGAILGICMAYILVWGIKKMNFIQIK